ncbi:MAG: YdeI/OmpD-associated family protein [Dehalococcoidia bacterium]
MKFRSVVQPTGKNTTGIPVPDEVVESLEAGKRPPVKVTVNGYTYRTSVASRDGGFMLSVSAEVRESAGVAANDEVDVDIELDTQPREVTVPVDFSDALDHEPEARRFFNGLSYSHKRRHVLSIEGAKTDETRQRRIARSVEMLRQGKI